MSTFFPELIVSNVQRSCYSACKFPICARKYFKAYKYILFDALDLWNNNLQMFLSVLYRQSVNSFIDFEKLLSTLEKSDHLCVIEKYVRDYFHSIKSCIPYSLLI